MVEDYAPFREYHRQVRWMSLTRWLSGLASIAAAAGVLSTLVAAAPPTTTTTAPPQSAPAFPVSVAIDSFALSEQSAQPVTAAAPLVATAALSESGPPAWTIDIDTMGYQAEVDACLWVRMDLGAVAPIVGAHNHCGGDIVLQMAIGDSVELRGTALDGAYTVTESRDAHAGDPADVATSGMTAAVILQTCYWHSGGRERLLALVRA